MKRTLTLFACVAICCAMMASCKNNKTAEPTPEEIQAKKVALADSVLAKIDEFEAKLYITNGEKFTFRSRELTEQEKAVKPDYLYDPSEVNNLVTKFQKINAVGILKIDMGVRYLYDMPVEETKEAITRLALEINLPIEWSESADQQDYSEIVRDLYTSCKENNELSTFWQYVYAMGVEVRYILVQNPDLFFSKISEKEWQNFTENMSLIREAIIELAPYDSEVAKLCEFREKYKVFDANTHNQALSTLQSAKEFYSVNKDKYVARRNALLQ